MANMEFNFEQGRRFGKAKGTFSKHAHGVEVDWKHDLPAGLCAIYHLAPNERSDHNFLCVPDREYRWCQTIDTNVPLGGTTSPYVDPRPSDDPGTPKPFYYTQTEHATFKKRYYDKPSRNAPATGTTTWRATLSLCAVNGMDVKRLMTIHYGFDLDSAGKVTEAKPADATDAQIKDHLNTLKSEFGSWAFE